MKSCAAGGWLLEPKDGDFYYWIPQPARLRKASQSGHILKEETGSASRLDITGSSAFLEFEIPAGCFFDVVIWQIPSEERNLIGALSQFAPIETQAVFLWGSHTTYSRPSDLYLYLINGHVYENQYAWPYKRKICSENDAHALYVTMNGLERATGKLLYGVLKRQLLLSILARQGSDGGWRHGEWSDGMEAHFRLHCSAMHLMLEALEEQSDAHVKAALTRAADFLSSKTDDTEFGKWFLHDELELSEAAMRKSPFHWKRSTALGKSASNMLVLNTHLDALIALERYRRMTGDDRFAKLVESGRKTASAVLHLRPAESLYRALFWAIGLTLLPTERAKRLPLHLRAVKRVTWKYLIPNLHWVKTKFPRLVMPGGYVDRALALRTWSFHYLTVNAMDLLRYRRMFPEDDVDGVSIGAMEFTHRSGILEKWAELDYEKYALGYWCEALYRLAATSSDLQCRGWLAESVVGLEKQDQGLPPSVLGGNGEIIPRPCQVPTPLLDDARLRVVNLCRSGVEELMIINPSNEAIDWAWRGDTKKFADLCWTDAHGRQLAKLPQRLGPGDWIRGVRDLPVRDG